MAYVPQLTPTSPDNTYTSDIYSTWNPFEQMPEPDRTWKPNNGMPNCTAYAWSRFWAICRPTSQNDRRPTLSLRNACWWYSNTADGYQRGQTPKLGAVMCWSSKNDFKPGHVAIVEEIFPDGSVRTSNSNWTDDQSQEQANWFYTWVIAPPYDTNTLDFQGFIYNPYSDSGGKLPIWMMRRKKNVQAKTIFGNAQNLRTRKQI